MACVCRALSLDDLNLVALAREREYNPNLDRYRHYLQPPQHNYNNQNNDERFHNQEFRGQFLHQDAWWNNKHNNDVGESNWRTNEDYHGESKLRQRRYHVTSDVLEEKNKQDDETNEKQTNEFNQNEGHKDDHDEEDYCEYL